MSQESTDNQKQLLVSGYSCRSVAWSAVRAGLQPVIQDQCQDWDLPENVVIEQTTDFTDIAADCPFLPTGGWENRFGFWQQLEQSRPVWGASAEDVRQIRDPQYLNQFLDSNEYKRLGCLFQTPANTSDDFAWLRKPMQSAGGFQHTLNTETPAEHGPCYWQQYLPGKVYSAQLFSSAPIERKHALPSGLASHSSTCLLGITWQLSGCPEVPAHPFLYTGNLGPVVPDEASNLSERVIDDLDSIARQLAEEFRLIGLWGIDFIIHDNHPYILEINPRYTSAMELLELSSKTSFLSMYLDDSLTLQKHDDATSPTIGKMIIYADRPWQIPVNWNWESCADEFERKTFSYNAWGVPVISDLPRSGTAFQNGDPICTVWAESDNVEECWQQLLENKTRLLQLMTRHWRVTSPQLSNRTLQPGSISASD